MAKRRERVGDGLDTTWQNACRFFSWDPFARTPKEQANVAALRAKGADVDVSIRPRKEWARLYAEKQLTKHNSAFAEKTRQFVRICG